MIDRPRYRPRIHFGAVAIAILLLALPTLAQQEQAPPRQPASSQLPSPQTEPSRDDDNKCQDQATTLQAPASQRLSQQPEPSEDGKQNCQLESPGVSMDRLSLALPDLLTVDNGSQFPPITPEQEFMIVARTSFDYIEFPGYGFSGGISRIASPVMQSSQQGSQQGQSGTSSTGSNAKQPDANSTGQSTAPASQATPPSNPQPKRILGVMPNFRAVSAGTVPPPPTPKQAFILATRNSFDYSSFIFVGVTSLLAEGTNAHPQLGKGIGGFGRYYWRGFVDKTDGNYFVLFILPTLFHQDERYYAMGKGGFWKRVFYSSTRIFVTPNYEGHDSFNISELVGRGIAQGISVAYYPSQDRTAGSLARKYAYALGRDALTNVFREFWPDIAVHVLHRHP